MKRRTFLSAVGSGLVSAAGTALPKAAFAAGAGEPIKLGLLFSQSGTMANGESLLKDTALMTIDQINAKGGVLGRQPYPNITRHRDHGRSNIARIRDSTVVSTPLSTNTRCPAHQYDLISTQCYCRTCLGRQVHSRGCKLRQ